MAKDITSGSEAMQPEIEEMQSEIQYEGPDLTGPSPLDERRRRVLVSSHNRTMIKYQKELTTLISKIRLQMHNSAYQDNDMQKKVYELLSNYENLGYSLSITEENINSEKELTEVDYRFQRNLERDVATCFIDAISISKFVYARKGY